MVAPRVGAWIETSKAFNNYLDGLSPLAWGRGLKQRVRCGKMCSKWSPLAWGRGLKLITMQMYKKKRIRSPLAWGRGLKQSDSYSRSC